jgi:uncharacterized membrane protein
MIQSFQDPHSRHALLVHFPIVLGALGLIPVLVLAVKKFHSPICSVVCVAWFAGAMIGLGLATGAGEEAYERVEVSQPALTKAEHDALEEHESLGEGAWLWAIPALAFSAVTLVPRKSVRVGGGVLLIVAATTLAGFVAITGHTGGLLVYQHGLGVPQRAMFPGAAVPAVPAVTPDVPHGRDDDD